MIAIRYTLPGNSWSCRKSISRSTWETLPRNPGKHVASVLWLKGHPTTWLSSAHRTELLVLRSVTESLTGWLRGLPSSSPPRAKAEGKSLSLSWWGGSPGAGAHQLESACAPVGAYEPTSTLAVISSSSLSQLPHAVSPLEYWWLGPYLKMGCDWQRRKNNAFAIAAQLSLTDLVQ